MSSNWNKLHFGMEEKFVLIRPVRPPPKAWWDNQRYLESRFDQKKWTHHPLNIKSARLHRRLCTHHHANHRRPQWNCLKWVVERVENRVQRMQAIRACVAATVCRDLKEPVAPVERSHEERVTFRRRRFLLLTHLVVTASTAQLCLMTQDEIRERKPREAQETRNRLRSANQEQQVAGSRGKYRNQKPSPTVITATVDRDLEPSKRPPTGGWAMRISDCADSIAQRAFRENACREWMTCLSCGARWSRKTGQDDIQVKMGLIIEQPCIDNLPCPGCASTTRLQQMTNKTETFFGCSRFPLCKRVVHTSHTMESRVSPSAHSCSAA